MATAYIKEMINATTSDIVYPVTKSQAVYMDDNTTTVQKAVDDITNANISVNALGKKIIENYTGSTLAGSARSIQTAINALNSSITSLQDINGTTGAYHNSVYRGKQLGTSVSSTQWTNISNGSFTDMYIGDYWTINSVDYMIAAFDYYYQIGDTSFTKHHLIVVPRTNLYSEQMKKTDTGEYIAGAEYNSTDGGYVQSDMRATGLDQAKTIAANAFGAAHILSHRIYLPANATDGISSGGAWIDSPGVELMAEIQVYGTRIRSLNDTGIGAIATTEKNRFPLFVLNPLAYQNRQTFWLQDVGTALYFCYVDGNGIASTYYSSYSSGVRPAICIGT